ncbi:TonB family protein [Salmonirosea aquatica]|uniref:TonB family protein n=1 Tax=Salmonirosea aquatica TaxID=2654236 RepID=A0A7C9FZ01_9BACT|nr:TonB family protein [Cytophagaceae bacterium SJW1-29]
MELATYFGEVSLYWLLLYGCYWLVLRRHTFFVLNRVYLLGALGVAFILPQVPYPEVAPPVPGVVYEMATQPIETIIVAPQNAMALPSAVTEPFPWGTFLWMVYVLGGLVMAVRLFRHIRQLLTFIQQGTYLDMDFYRLCLLENDHLGSFSFLNYIVINRTDYAENFDTILSHELVHVRQRHSWDILLVEVLRVVFWFNPVLILYKKSLQQVHEYLADREVCAWDATPRDRYAEFMVSYSLGSPMAALANPFFNSSFLKDRIMMLYKNRNSNWSLGKYAAVALLVGFVSLLAASCEQKAGKVSEADESTAAITDKEVTIEGMVVRDDQMPIPGASIEVEGTELITKTDSDGRFKIVAPVGGKVVVGYPGFNSFSFNVLKEEKKVDYLLELSTDSPGSYSSVPFPGENGPLVYVKGNVSGADGKPLPGTSVTIRHTQRGTTTDSRGEYRIEVPKKGWLEYSFTGYKKAVAIIEGQGTVNATLIQDGLPSSSTARWVSASVEKDIGSKYAISQPTLNSPQDSVYTVVAENPEFPGGIKAMYQFIQDNVKYPAAARRANVEGKVFLTFVVRADGAITQVKILKGRGFGTDEEAIRVVSAMPKWKPGELDNGQKVNVKYNLPISFVLPKKEKGLSARSKKSKANVVATEQSNSVNTEVDRLVGLKF